MEIIKFLDYTCKIKTQKYFDGNTALALIDVVDEAPVAIITINFPGLLKNEIAIKNYSENEGLLDILIEKKVISEPIREVVYGFVKIPICKLLIPIS